MNKKATLKLFDNDNPTEKKESDDWHRRVTLRKKPSPGICEMCYQPAEPGGRYCVDCAAERP